LIIFFDGNYGGQAASLNIIILKGVADQKLQQQRLAQLDIKEIK